MCGIAGFVESQIRSVRQRGRRTTPGSARCATSFGIEVRTTRACSWRDGAALGMRRLSIIDVGGGHQPISNEDGSIWVVFNGEIYNYRALRADLIAQRTRLLHGHRYRDHRACLRAVGRRCVRSSSRHVRDRALGSPYTDAAPRPRSRWHQALHYVRAAVAGSRSDRRSSRSWSPTTRRGG